MENAKTTDAHALALLLSAATRIAERLSVSDKAVHGELLDTLAIARFDAWRLAEAEAPESAPA